MTTPTPADTLRAAAEKLRATAGNATEGAWALWRDLDHQGYITVGDAAGVITPPALESSGACNPVAHVYVEEDAEHIALMHPGVGLAVGRWLESWTGIDLAEDGPMPEDAQHALAVARQILGTTETEDAPPAPARRRLTPGEHDRAAVLREAMEVAGQMGGRFGTDEHGDHDAGWNDACEAIAVELRQLADEAQQPTPAATEEPK